VRIDNYLLREKSLTELESTLREQHPDELSQRVIDITGKLSELRLKELKAQREIYLVKEREDYYARVNRTQVDHIKKLEEEVSKSDAKYNEREDFWRKRYDDQLKMIFKQSGQTGKMNLTFDKDGKVKMPLLNTNGHSVPLTGVSDEIAFREIHKDMAKEVGNRRELRSSQKDYGTSRSNVVSQGAYDDMKDRIRILSEDNELKQQRIDRLKEELKTRNYDVNYQTKNID
jgi:hypothetical protein